MNDIFTFSNLIDFSLTINEPLKHTQRIKYTAFDASTKYITFGASSGSLYLFNRKPICKFLHLIPNKYGKVNKLSISPEEKYIAFATHKGQICVYVLNLSAHSSPQVITANYSDDSLTTVTCIRWSLGGKQFYFGDNKGQVHLVTLTFFMGRNLISLSVHPILFLDSPIVQISDYESLLVVSSHKKCILCNTEYEEYKQIGNKPRDGEYGACLLISLNEQLHPSRIICARPGSRFWEVDLEGIVLQTHQFKAALAYPPTKLPINEKKLILPFQNYQSDIKSSIDNTTELKSQNLQYSKLQVIRGEFIFTHTNSAIYIFDIRQSKVILWSNDVDEILDCQVVDFDEIIIYEKSGAIYTIRLQILQSYAIDLVQQSKFLDCSLLLKKHLKYFAEKAKEDYELTILNKIKNYLIDSNEYEMLNDLSVIFDSITQAETELSSGSGNSLATAERQKVSDNGSSGSCHSSIGSASISGNKKNDINKGVYVLENSFSDNLKSKNDKERLLKDTLLTVTGKFGKNIIKYKFNIFNDEQKTLVNDLIPPKDIDHEKKELENRQAPSFHNFQFDENDSEEIVCKKSSSSSKKSTFNNENSKDSTITDNEKTIYNLFLIYKTSKISNINFLDRYKCVFDLYKSKSIVEILKKLAIVMEENGDSKTDAQYNCFEMYFNYLNPELIYEFDQETIEFIIDGFCMINESNNAEQLMIRCNLCKFPIRFDTTCRYHELGEILFKYLWSRNEHEQIYQILFKIPSMFDVICRFYIHSTNNDSNNFEKILSITLNYGNIELFQEAAKFFNYNEWDKCFEKFSLIQNGKCNCIYCNELIKLNLDCQYNYFYTWNCFLNLALEFLNSNDILDLVLKYSKEIPSDAIERDFYKKCILKSIENL